MIPTMNVYDNVAFALRVANVSTRDIRRRVPYILSLVGLASKARCKMNELSGGEQQRVALARALVNNPKPVSYTHLFQQKKDYFYCGFFFICHNSRFIWRKAPYSVWD